MRDLATAVLVGLLVLSVVNANDGHDHTGVKIASFRFEYVKSELVITGFIVVIGLFKLVYTNTKYLQAVVPESCLLILLGVLIGWLFWFAEDDSKSAEAVRFLEFDTKSFFFLLLPPIILESAYSLNDRAFTQNLGTIIVYAVVGTILNIAIVGSALIALDWSGAFGSLGLNALDCLLFASLIAAVDPVAVLAVFSKLGVNRNLFFLVFGESLLNDAVTVVCYNLISDARSQPAITISDGLLGIVAFIVVSGGGLLIGLVFGVLSALFTRFTISARVVEPVIFVGMAYLAYVIAELFHVSGIISMIAAGVLQAKFKGNLSAKSNVTILYSVKCISSMTESLIFLILGVMLVNKNSWFWSDWHPLFAFSSLALCVIARFTVVFGLTYLINRETDGVRYISLHEQIIMGYGGLRGAVSFSLAFMLPDSMSGKATILAATYVVILATNFVQGCTIEWLVRCLRISLAKQDDRYRLFNAFNKGMVTHMTQGVETLLGVRDRNIMRGLSKLSNRYLKPVLERDYVRDQGEHRLLSIDNEEALRENLERTEHLRQHETIAIIEKEGSRTFELMDAQHDRILRERRLADKEARDGATDHTKDEAALEHAVHEANALLDVAHDERRASKARADADLVDVLTVDVAKLEALVSGGSHSYATDKNLVSEVQRDRLADQRRRNHIAHYLRQLTHLADTPTTTTKSGLFGGSKKLKTTPSIKTQMLAAASGALSVSNQQQQQRDMDETTTTT